jgi:alcohol dehydrogenase
LKIEAVGICGSYMHAYHGHDPRRVPPMILGHEFVGTIVSGVNQGARVTGNPLIGCGVCDYCVQGRPNLCSNRTMVGMSRAGAYAELMSIPAKTLIELPPGMDAVQAALTEPAATSVHALHLAERSLMRPLNEATALVIGGGAIGLLMALLMKSKGLVAPWLAEVNALRRASAEKHAGVRGFNPLESDGPAEASCEVVIDAVGSKATRGAAFRAVKPGGVIVHIGLQDWASEIDMRKLTLAEITLMGTYTYTTADLRATVKLLYAGAFGDLSWVQTMPLQMGAQAFSDLDSGKLASAKVVLLP